MCDSKLEAAFRAGWVKGLGDGINRPAVDFIHTSDIRMEVQNEDAKVFMGQDDKKFFCHRFSQHLSRKAFCPGNSSTCVCGLAQ